MKTHFLLCTKTLAALLILCVASRTSIAEWQPHQIKQADGRGGWITRPAQIQTLKHPGGKGTMPFGMVQMGNGEIAFIGAWHNGSKQVPVLSFSKDGGAIWSEFRAIPGQAGRPMMLTYLGKGNLSFRTGPSGPLHFSSDYGRSWPESIPLQLTSDELPFNAEGAAWVERDADGVATKIMEIGWHYKIGQSHPVGDATGVFRYSTDGGRTWQGEVQPAEWKFITLRKGEPHVRGVSEGSLVRAANGWLVVAPRTDIPSALLDGPHDNSLEGTAISISKDDGRTWSPLNMLFTAGRHHAVLHRLSDGTLVCVMIVRDDWRDGHLASQMRGCDAVVSYDNGVSWNLDERIILDEFEHLDPGYWVDGQCGHIGSAVLDDGFILTAYGHYLKESAVLIKWKPDAQSLASSKGER